MNAVNLVVQQPTLKYYSYKSSVVTNKQLYWRKVGCAVYGLV